MLLHHIATCSLYFCMIFGNGLSIGCVIAYLHDIADIFVCCARFFGCTEREDVAVVFFVGLIAAWLWTRIILLPMYIYRIFLEEWDERCRMFCRTNGFFLTVLQVLHVYWFHMFYSMAITKIKTGKSEDIQNRPAEKKNN
jgi:hypothetical protein